MPPASPPAPNRSTGSSFRRPHGACVSSPPRAGEMASEATPEGVSLGRCTNVIAAGPLPTLPRKRERVSFILLAMRLCIRVLLTPLQESPSCLPFPKGREAERRTAHHGFRPAAERKACQRMRRAPSLVSRKRGIKTAAPSPFGAPPRSCAEGPDPRLGSGPRFLESPDPNGRTLSGTSAASTWQSDHAPDGRCPEPPGSRVTSPIREPHPPHRSAVTGRRPFDGRAGPM